MCLIEIMQYSLYRKFTYFILREKKYVCKSRFLKKKNIIE